MAEGEGGSACSSAGQTTQGRTFRACDGAQGAQGARAAWPACSRCRPPRHHAPPVSEADVRAGGGHAARPHRSPRCRRLPAAGAELRAEAPGSLGSRGTCRCPPAMRCLRHCWARPHDLNRGGGGCPCSCPGAFWESVLPSGLGAPPAAPQAPLGRPDHDPPVPGSPRGRSPHGERVNTQPCSTPDAFFLTNTGERL